MLSKDENELLTRVGPGTPMGDADAPLLDPGAAVRGAAGARLPAGARPAAGRGPRRLPRQPAAGSASSTSSARTAAPRCGSGRNEEDGLRCVYHGWKFDVDGTCVDQMNEPEQFANKIQA